MRNVGVFAMDLPGRTPEASPKLRFPGLQKLRMSLLLVRSQDIWWEKFALFMSLKTKINRITMR